MKRFLFSAVILLLFAGCDSKLALVKDAPLISLRITDDGGRFLSLPRQPTKIVALGAGPEAMLRALGAGDQLVPMEITNPLNLKALDSTGADIALAPLGLFDTHDILGIEIETGIPVYQMGGNSFEGLFTAIRHAGQVVGHEDKATRLADSLQALIGRVSDSTRKQATYGTVMVLSTDPLLVAGGKGLLNEMIATAGGKNLFEDQKEAFAATTVDEIIARHPEYIILPTKDGQVYANWMVANPGLSTTPADIQQHIFLVDADYYLQVSPQNVDALLQLTQILHTSLFPQKFVGK